MCGMCGRLLEVLDWLSGMRELPRTLTSAPSSTAPTDCYCLAGFQPSAIAQNSSSGTLPPHPLSTPAASVAEVANLKCEACPAGQYKQLSGDVACVLCPPGICLSIYR